jgi:protein gp37
MNASIIAWTNLTWNPTHGCSRVSEGCRNCYAEQLSLQRGWTKTPWTANHADENVLLKPHKLRDPYKIKTPSRVFVNSMSDLFHPNIPEAYLHQIWEVMCDLPQHTFQILTKRPERAAVWAGPWPSHIWMGTSVEGPRAVNRIAHLQQCAAQVRFLSCEPLLAPLGEVDLAGIHWLIVGGESGQHYRPMAHAWARDLRDASADQGTAFFFKQSAARFTERGTTLQYEDGNFYTIRQYPGILSAPTLGDPHQYTWNQATPIPTA